MQTKTSARGRGQEASSLETPLFAGLSGLGQTQSCSVSTPQLVFFPLISLPYSCLKAVLVSGFKWLSYCFGILIMDLWGPVCLPELLTDTHTLALPQTQAAAGAECQSTPPHRLPLGKMMDKQIFTCWRAKGCTSMKQIHPRTFSCPGYSGDNDMLVELRCSPVFFWGSTFTGAWYLLCARSTQCHCLVCSVQSQVPSYLAAKNSPCSSAAVPGSAPFLQSCPFSASYMLIG